MTEFNKWEEIYNVLDNLNVKDDAMERAIKYWNTRV